MIEARNITYHYDKDSPASLREVSLAVQDGEIVLCTGRSGCGKSTLVRVLNGLCPNYYGGILSGSVHLDGENTASMDISQIAAQAGTLFQDPERQFFALNVEDEIAFALEWQGISQQEIAARVEDVIRRFGLEGIRGNAISALSEGQKQKVGLAEIVALHGKNLILDEPTANLDPESTAELGQFLLQLKQEGYCIFIVDHRHYWLQGIADRVLIMQDGRIEQSGSFELLSDGAIQQTYGLRKASVTDRRQLLTGIEPDCSNWAVKGQDISFAYKNGREIFSHFDFAIPEGISVLIGDNGTGKTTLSRLIFGLEKAQQGSITFRHGNKKKPLQLGSLVLQNTDYQLNMQTVYQEVAVCMQLAHGTKPEPSAVMALLSELDLDALSYRHPHSLSGGQKQRLVIACALAKEPQVLILDEPTSGLDGANMQRIAHILHSFARDGRAALIITHDLEFLDDPALQALRMPDKSPAQEAASAAA